MGTAATPVRYSQVNMIKIGQSNKNHNSKHGLQQGRGSHGYCCNTSAIFSGKHDQNRTIKTKTQTNKQTKTTIRSMVYNKGGVVMGTAATPVRYSQVNMVKIRQSKQKPQQTNKNNDQKHGLQQGWGS